MRADHQRRFVGLGDRHQLPVRLLDDVLPGLGFIGRLLRSTPGQPAEQRSADRSEGRGDRPAGRLRSGDAAGRTAGDGAHRAARSDRHLPLPDDHPPRHRVRLLGGGGGVIVWGIAAAAGGEPEHGRSEQEGRQQQAAQSWHGGLGVSWQGQGQSLQSSAEKRRAFSPRRSVEIRDGRAQSPACKRYRSRLAHPPANG